MLGRLGECVRFLRAWKIEEGGEIVRRLSRVVMLVAIGLLVLGPSVAGARNEVDNDKATQKQSALQQTFQEWLAQKRPAQDQAAQDKATQTRPTQNQPAQDQGTQDEQQGVATLPIRYVTKVSIQDSFFEPANSTVAPRTAVLWVNEGAEPHTVTADDGSFDSTTLNPGQFFLVAFEEQGRVTYHCALHPEMVGSVTVSEDSGSSVPTEESQAPAEGSQAPAEQQQSSEGGSESTDGGSGY